MQTGVTGEVTIPVITVPDLTGHEVLQHFAKSSKAVPFLTFLLELNRYDSWAVDFRETTSPDVFAIQLFLAELATFVERNAQFLHLVPVQFSDLLAHLTTSRCMYLIRYVGQNNPVFLDQLTELVQLDNGTDSNIATVRRRFEEFSKARMLSEIFSGERLTRIATIMGAYKDE